MTLNTTYTVGVNVPMTVELTMPTTDPNSLVADIPVTPTVWPMNLFGYISFAQSPLDPSDCESTLGLLRFIYWAFDNQQYLHNVSVAAGFTYLSTDSYTMMQSHLLDAQCDGSTLLVYTDSTTPRSNVLYGIAVTCLIIFMGLIITAWYLHPKRRALVVIVNNVQVLFGLVCTLIGTWHPETDIGKVSITFRPRLYPLVATTRLGCHLCVPHVVPLLWLHQRCLFHYGVHTPLFSVRLVSVKRSQRLAHTFV